MSSFFCIFLKECKNCNPVRQRCNPAAAAVCWNVVVLAPRDQSQTSSQVVEILSQVGKETFFRRLIVECTAGLVEMSVWLFFFWLRSSCLLPKNLSSINNQFVYFTGIFFFYFNSPIQSDARVVRFEMCQLQWKWKKMKPIETWQFGTAEWHRSLFFNLHF